MEKGEIVREWDREEFASLSESELAAYELRPVNLEERYIREYSGTESAYEHFPYQVNEAPRDEPYKNNDILLKSFYFTYLHDTNSLPAGKAGRNRGHHRWQRLREIYLSPLSLWA